jgi:hypothetical protein
MAAGNHTLGTIRGTIEIDYDGAGIVRAIKDTDKVKNRMGTLTGASDKVLGAFGKFASGGLKVAGAVNLVNNAAGLLVGTLAVVGPLAAAGFATAPGIILAWQSALVIAKVAVAGVGDAMKAAAEGGAKFDEAMKKLSPEAQKFVKAYQKAVPVIDQVKKSIQDAFFAGNAGLIRDVTGAIVSLRAQATGVAGAMGKVVQSTVAVATSSKNVEGLRSILSGLTAFLIKIRTSIGPVVTGFIALGAQVAGFGGTVGGAVNGALTKLAEFLNNIDVAALFAKALPIIQQLGLVLGNVVDIFTTLFSGISVDGAGAASILATITGSLAAFLHTAEGQQALQALGQAMAAISAAVGPVFLALLQALAPAIVTLAPGIAELATTIAGQLVPIIQALAPLLNAVAGFLSDNIGWIEPLAVAVVALALGYKTYAAAVGVVNAVKALELVAFARSAAAWVASTATIIANGVAVSAWAVAMAVARTATVVWTGVQWLLNAALTANPIGIIIVAIGALIAIIVLIATKTTWFQTIWKAVWGFLKAVGAWFAGPFANFFVQAWNKIVSGAQTLWGWIVTIFNAIKTVITTQFNIVKTVVMAVWNFIVGYIKFQIALVKAVISAGVAAAKAVWSAAMNAVKAVARAVWAAIVTTIKGYITGVKNAIAGVKSVIATVKNAFTSAKNAASSALSSLVSTVKGIPGRVIGALGNLGSLLYSKGQALVRGFINGIASMIGAVRDKAASVVSAVTRFLPGSPAKEGPLSGKGYALLRARRMMADLAQGIEDGSQKPVVAMAGAINPMARATVPAGSTMKSGASSTPTVAPSAGGSHTYQLVVDGKQMAEFVVDAVTGAPIQVNKASNEGSRKSSWAGSGR